MIGASISYTRMIQRSVTLYEKTDWMKTGKLSIYKYTY